jgi:hypothetical protein
VTDVKKAKNNLDLILLHVICAPFDIVNLLVWLQNRNVGYLNGLDHHPLALASILVNCFMKQNDNEKSSIHHLVLSAIGWLSFATGFKYAFLIHEAALLYLLYLAVMRIYSHAKQQPSKGKIV